MRSSDPQRLRDPQMPHIELAAADGDCRRRCRPRRRLDDDRSGVGVSERGRHAAAASRQGRRQAAGCSTPRRRSWRWRIEANARVIVNDRADIARLSGADGVHVGQDDLAPALRPSRSSGEQAMVGLSTHTPEQVDAALGSPVRLRGDRPGVRHAHEATGYDGLGLECGRRSRGSNARAGAAARSWRLAAIDARDCAGPSSRGRRRRRRDQRSARRRQSGGPRPRVPRAPHGIIPHEP